MKKPSDRSNIPTHSDNFKIIYHTGQPKVSIYQFSPGVVYIHVSRDCPLDEIIRLLEGAHMLFLDVRDTVDQTKGDSPA